MKKLLIFLLTILCLFSFAIASACNQGGKPKNLELINGFNCYDDLAMFDLNPTTFGGSWKLNKDTAYIAEGEGSWKVYVDTTYANQPNFKMKTGNLKSDITDVTEFKLWVHSDSVEPFEIIITAYAADTIVCAPTATVNQGENDLTFKINRALVVQSGQMITDYSISFSGITGGTTLYIDNFSAKTTSAPVVIKEEIKAVINAIANVDKTTTRTELETIMQNYRALSTEDKMCVTNYSTLNAAITNYYISDLTIAKEETPKTWLYFNEPFGEIQVVEVSQGISNYMYSEEQHYGNEKGSLKVEFTTTSTNWLTVKTSADTPVPEQYIEFYVYNDSDQSKALCVGWNAPLHPVVKDYYYVIQPRTWTQIFCESKWLYDAGGASGGIQICGLFDPTKGGAQPPKGVMYFSSVTKRDDQMEINEARSGEDENTLYFFDRELGVRQIASSYAVDFSYSTAIKYGNEDGSLAINVKNQGDPEIVWRQFGYKFNEGDYVVFYVYNDSDSDVIDISLNTKHRQRCYKGVWTMVIWKAADVAVETNNWSWLIARNYGTSDYSGMTWVNTNGNIYFSKAKVYSADKVKDLTTVESNYEYTIGETTLVGKPSVINGDYADNPSAFNDANFQNPYYVDGLLRWQIHPVKALSGYEPMVGFKFKETYDITSNCYLYVTVKGAVEGQVYAQIFNDKGFTGDGHIATPTATLVETLSNGFAIYKIHVGSYVNNAKAINLNAFRLCVRNLKKPHTGEVVLSNIEVVYETVE